MDKLSAEQRHKNMAAIRGKDTKPEMIVRRGLWKRGFRYRLNSPKLPGCPDLVLRKYRTCIFVNDPNTTSFIVQNKFKVEGKTSTSVSFLSSSRSQNIGGYDNMRGVAPASEEDMEDNGMSRCMENNDEEGWN